MKSGATWWYVTAVGIDDGPAHWSVADKDGEARTIALDFNATSHTLDLAKLDAKRVELVGIDLAGPMARAGYLEVRGPFGKNCGEEPPRQMLDLSGARTVTLYFKLDAEQETRRRESFSYLHHFNTCAGSAASIKENPYFTAGGEGGGRSWLYPVREAPVNRKREATALVDTPSGFGDGGIAYRTPKGMSDERRRQVQAAGLLICSTQYNGLTRDGVRANRQIGHGDIARETLVRELPHLPAAVTTPRADGVYPGLYEALWDLAPPELAALRDDDALRREIDAIRMSHREWRQQRVKRDSGPFRVRGLDHQWCGDTKPAEAWLRCAEDELERSLLVAAYANATEKLGIRCGFYRLLPEGPTSP